ncbi:MAG: DUF4232 domain-containing protein [Chloroflexi bacterium]|nr:MAG: DUF4232 domain-containing protein [Chloroflexota bacterium]
MRARSLLLAVLAITLCGCAAGSHLAAGMKNDPTAPVPWISATPTAMPLATPSPTVIPAGTRACQAADLQAVFGGIGALTGGQLAASILFGNRSAGACVLQGVPAVQLFDSGGHQIPLTTRPAEGVPPPEPVLVPPGTADVQAYIPRAGIAYVGIEWQTHDGAGFACAPTPREATAVVVSFPGGGSSPRVAVSDAMSRWSSIAPCYGRVAVSAFQQWPAPAASPTPNPLESLTISVAVPPAVAPGSVLGYTVTLQNAGSQPVVFPAECPVYLEWAASSTRAFAKESHVLNCRPVGTIAPAQSVRFAMQIPVPSGTQPGLYDLRWMFVGSLGLNPSQGKATVTVSG